MVTLMASILLSSPVNTFIIVALNFPSGILAISVLLRPLAVVLSSSLIWVNPLFSFCLFSVFFFCLIEKPVMFLAHESNDFMKKMSCHAQGLELKEVLPLCVACALLLCSACTILQASYLQRFSLHEVVSVWSLTWMWQALPRCAFVCLWNVSCHHLHHYWGPEKLGDVLWVGVFAGLLDEWPASQGLWQNWVRRCEA